MLQSWARLTSIHAAAISLRCRLRPLVIGVKRAVNINSQSHRSSSSEANRVVIETPPNHQIDRPGLVVPDPVDPQTLEQRQQRGDRQVTIDAWCGRRIRMEQFASKEEYFGLSVFHSDGGHQISDGDDGHQIIGTFNIISDDGTRVSKVEPTAVYIPGAAPRWVAPPLGSDISAAASTPSPSPSVVDKMSAPRGRRPLRFQHPYKMDKYLWKIPVRAVEAMSGPGALDDIDVMITAQRLDALWKLSAGSTVLETSANATFFGNTLFIDSFEPVGLETTKRRDAPNHLGACGQSWPTQYADSLQHFQVVRYKLGGLNLAVVANVDATIDLTNERRDAVETLPARVIIYSKFPKNWISSRGMHQYWLRRCPVTINYLVEDGKLVKERIGRQGKHWKTWKSFKATEGTIGRLASLLHRLRELLKRAAPGEPCIVKSKPILARHVKGAGLSSLAGKQGQREGRLAIFRATHGMYPLPLKHVPIVPADQV